MLELACGTGLWTVGLGRYATSVTSFDTSTEVLEINRARRSGAWREPSVRHVEADLFGGRPDAAYDAVFFGFWLSHVSPERVEAFRELARFVLRSGGTCEIQNPEKTAS